MESVSFNPNKKAISAEEAKTMGIEDEVIDAWMSQTHANPQYQNDYIRDWYAGKIKLIVDLRPWGIKL